jgi:hypothetical protein
MGILRRAELEGLLTCGRAIGDWLRSSGGCRIVNLGERDGTGDIRVFEPYFLGLPERAVFDMQLHGHGLEHRVGDRACARRDARRRYQSSTAREIAITYASPGFNTDLITGVLERVHSPGNDNDTEAVQCCHGSLV